MVTMPREFVATKIPGYFWNTKTKRLFTAKLGVLREMKYTPPSQWTHYREGYRVSHQGRRRWLEKDYLNSLTPDTNSVFPVKFTVKRTPGNDDVPVQLSLLPEGTIVDVYIRG